jgi:diguanylate cyclase (GGDEF)-like protein
MRHNLALLIVDIDHLSRVNDAYGRAAGDTVIEALGDLCRRYTRETDVVARLGGEEFAILLPKTNLEQAAKVGERIRSLVESTVFQSPETMSVVITVSVGVAEQHPEDAAEADLFDRADAALRQAKAAGRNRVVCTGALEHMADKALASG